VCGGASGPLHRRRSRSGLSPRVRGSPRSANWCPTAHGSIPACAGEPRGPRRSASARRVYPRVCGGATSIVTVRIKKLGLSPRVRGSPDLREFLHLRGGSIPACAGEPRSTACPGRSWRVYPRVCGGAPARTAKNMSSSGLSPRVRGSPEAQYLVQVLVGSIPACAGEPDFLRIFNSFWRVYPRVCGGAGRNAVVDIARTGLSPRVRGSHQRHPAVGPRAGSIPACAGEPAGRFSPAQSIRVYPRVCGGASSSASRKAATTGLSPRVRGSRPGLGLDMDLPGSIPACAGEPWSCATCFAKSRVYPRVCGGACSLRKSSRRPAGLSPRVRGSILGDGDALEFRGSIPACAGEPAWQLPASPAVQVYPRVCGGAPDAMEQGGDSRVYPRVCGGAARRQGRLPCQGGLSPRVRGSR